jgi:NitT/TauT family transport system substrate-binding protein
MATRTPPSGGTTRRDFLRRSGLVACLAAGGGSLLPACAEAPGSSGSGGTNAFTLQLGWLVTNGVIGEIAAIEKGFYEEAGITVSIRPGGPNNDGISAVASGSAQVGRYSSSPRIMLAQSKGLPLQAIAAGVQKHPYAYFSLPENPVRSAQDLVGKTVGIQQTAEVLLDAVLAKNGIDKSDLTVKIIGSDMTPLVTGQVDVVSGWVINVGQLQVLPEDYVTTLLWDLGIQLYAYPYYTTGAMLDSSADQLAGFIGATAKGWGWARENIEEAVGLLLERAPELDREEQVSGAERLMQYMWTEETAANGWGAMSRQTWQSQIETWASLDQFQGDAPSVEEVMTTSVLEASASSRPSAGGGA